MRIDIPIAKLSVIGDFYGDGREWASLNLPDPKKAEGSMFECQYCGRKMTKLALSIGHVRNHLLDVTLPQLSK